MDPQQNPNQTPYSIDYLNQIAPPTKQPGVGNKLFFLLIGGGLLVAIIIGVVAFSSGGNGPTKKMQTLAARLATLHTISDKEQKNIKSSQLRSTNSNFTLFLANANRDITGPLSKNGVDVAKLDKTITASETGAELQKSLDDARLNAIYDRIYAREMGYQLDTVAALMKELYTGTNSKALKDFLVATDANLQPIKKQFYEFNAANS